MQPAEYYLKELLFDYDCVTIPGLGGFIMQSQPAKINRGKNRISPPSRYPSFNSLLNHDDGLLISAISRAEHISYRDAGSVISNFAENCKKRISSGEGIILGSIGELSSGPDGEIRFRPLNQLNFLAGVYGMDPLNLYPVSRPQDQTRVTRRPADRTPGQSRERKPAAVKWTLMVSVPVILFLLYGIIFPTSIQNLYTNYSGIVSDIGYPKGVPVPVLMTPEPNPVEKPVAVVETVMPESPRYFIIGGCFKNEENAGKFLAELINRGFEAEKAGTNNRGHMRISYKSFADKASALPYLHKIRNEENASAWLLKY